MISKQYRLPALVALGLVVCAAALLPIARTRLKAARPAPPPPAASAALQTLTPAYYAQAGIDGEIFPAFANFASLQPPRERKLPTVAVRILNPTQKTLKNRVAVQVPGWSDPEIQAIEVPAGDSRVLKFAPVFLPRFFANREITPATAVVTASDAAGNVLYKTTLPLRLRPAEDMFWGPQFRYASFIAAWVTPHDPRVEDILSRAKEFMPGRRLPGYENWKNAAAQVHTTYQQARAIYRALQQHGVSYVKSSTTFGQHLDVSERVRFPRESLDRVSANCIDGAVMYAALFENLGMDPVIVLVPGHAYVGVREAQRSENYLYLETALTGRASFDSAVLSASRGLRKYRPEQILRIPIAAARRDGIFPMPLPGRAPQVSAHASTPNHGAAE